MEDISLITSMAVVLGIALVGGIIAQRLKLPVILGYLLTGIIIGPNVTGLVADTEEVETLATIGVVFLMFTLGIEFSFRTLKKIGLVATGGGILQIIGTGIIGYLLAWGLHYPSNEAVIFAFFISLSSTIIVLKSLMDRGELGSPHGKIMTGILLVQDLSVVPMMAILPALGSSGSELMEGVGWAILKAIVFLGVTVVLGLWGFPWFMKTVAGGRSRELFLIAVVSLIFGASYAADQFGLSIALGAFLAGLLVSESEFSYQTMADIRPLRDIFAVLFFASLGMLADPEFILENPEKVGIAVSVVVVGKFLISAIVPRAFGNTAKTNLFVGSGLFQIGEFSFILAALALEESLISNELYSLTLSVAFITILLTPFAIGLTSWSYYRMTSGKRVVPLLTGEEDQESAHGDGKLSNHVVICGYGDTARKLGIVLQQRGFSYVIIDIDPLVIGEARKKGTPCIFGDASQPEVLAAARLEKARILVIAFPDLMSASLVIRNALEINHRLDILARVHGEEARITLKEMGAAQLVHPDVEAGLEIVRHTLHRFGLDSQEIRYIVNRLREEES
ncbi:MAG: cation:proton antiporter [Dehalococcoidia bacterium]